MSKTCLIVCGGEFSSDFADEFSVADFVIAADSGFDNAKKLGIKPDLLIGDFDSIKTDVQELQDIQIQQLPCEKDDTDTMFAIKLAIEKGFDKIYLACAFGNRLDHSFANLQALAYINSKGCAGVAFGKGIRCLFLSENSDVELENQQFNYFSIFSFTQNSVLSIEGAKYNLEKASISSVFPIGISNEWKTDGSCVKISLLSGGVFVMEVQEEQSKQS